MDNFHESDPRERQGAALDEEESKDVDVNVNSK